MIVAVIVIFVVNVLATILAVVVNSVGTRWLGTWLPAAWTTRWYASAWREFQLGKVLLVTFEIAAAVVVLSALIGVPAAYALARRNFPGKSLLMVLFLLPLLVPPITYGIPLATVLYKVGLAGTMAGVDRREPRADRAVHRGPDDPLHRADRSARRGGRSRLRRRHGAALSPVLLPLLLPGILAATLLALVRTVSMFELTFLTAGPTSQTLVVSLYYSVFAAGVRAASRSMPWR